MRVMNLLKNKKIATLLTSKEISVMKFKNMYTCEKKCKNENRDCKMERSTPKKILMIAKIQKTSS
jgi:hypothetical protein